MKIEVVRLNMDKIGDMIDEASKDKGTIEVGKATRNLLTALTTLLDKGDIFDAARKKLTKEEYDELAMGLIAGLSLCPMMSKFDSPNDPELIAFKKKHGLMPANEA